MNSLYPSIQVQVKLHLLKVIYTTRVLKIGRRQERDERAAATNSDHTQDAAMLMSLLIA
jgi:hypothetical protein